MTLRLLVASVLPALRHKYGDPRLIPGSQGVPLLLKAVGTLWAKRLVGYTVGCPSGAVLVRSCLLYWSCGVTQAMITGKHHLFMMGPVQILATQGLKADCSKI